MPKDRVKLDYNNLIKSICDILSKSGSISVIQKRFGIGIGLNLLTQNLQKIAERVIELKDDVLLEILLDMDVIKRSKQEVGNSEDSN